MYRTIKDRLAIKIEAKRMFLSGVSTAKEISSKVGVSENTISKWAKDNNWQALRKLKIEKILSVNPESENSTITDLKVYLRLTRPALYQEIELAINEFINLTK